MARSALAIFLLTLAWPIAQMVVFATRFGRLPPGGVGESAVFLAPGLVTAVFLVWLLRRAPTRAAATGAVLGYLVLLPLGLAGSLLGGLMLPPLLGSSLYGALPVLLGTAVGFAIGRLVDRAAR